MNTTTTHHPTTNSYRAFRISTGGQVIYVAKDGGETRSYNKAMTFPSFEQAAVHGQVSLTKEVEGGTVSYPSAKKIPIGQKVRSVQIASWGEGTVIAYDFSPKNKPYRVQRADGAIGYFHHHQLEVVPS